MPVVAKTFVRTLKGKIYNKITANDTHLIMVI